MNRKYFLITTVLVGMAAYGLNYANNKIGNGKIVSSTNLNSNMVDVKLPALNSLEEVGEKSFVQYCANCHGISGAGTDGVAPPLIHKIYEPSHHGDIAFQFAAQRGVRAHHWPFGNMPPVQNITLPEIKNITVYIRALQRANGIN